MKIQPNDLYRLWQDYVKEINNRQQVHEDDDKWGINTYVLGQHFGSRKELVLNRDAKTRAFREKLIALFENKNLCMLDKVAFEVYGEQWVVKNKRDLANLGVAINMTIAVDLTTMVTVKRDEPHFDYFFTLKLSLLEVNEVGLFLEYQFNQSFSEDFLLFKQFMLGISLKYKSESLQNNHGLPSIGHDVQLMIDNSIKKIKKEHKAATKILKEPANVQSLQSIKEPVSMKEISLNDFKSEPVDELLQSIQKESELLFETREEMPWMEPSLHTNRQQALMLVVGLEALGLDVSNNDDLSNIARLLHLLTGRPFTKIQNSTPYKMLREVQALKNKKVMEQDLIQLQDQFEKVKWNNAVEKTQLKINKLKEKYKKQKI